MKFTYNWIKDYIDLKLPAEELADRLTMAGLEVVALERKGTDVVFEVEITSNRPDWLSVLGIAREIAVLTGTKIKNPVNKIKEKRNSGEFIKVEVENNRDCPLYTARIINDVKVGPSPQWLKERLELIGCRSVNNVVDITNYCLFELGEPLHAFDLDKISPDRIIIRRGKPGERLVAIDGALRDLDHNILVIADKQKPLALAGIMGGKESEVTYSTKNILLEAAIFNPILIRRARQAQGIQSESSYRFERGVGREAAENASCRAGKLIMELCSGRQSCFKATGSSKVKAKLLKLNMLNLEKVLGLRIKASVIKNILLGLGFKVKAAGKSLFSISVPSFRQDIGLEEDLIEEIARIYGYEHIPISLPRVLPSLAIREEKSLIYSIKNIMVGLGLNEAITYSLNDPGILEDFSCGAGYIEIANPLSKEQAVLRTTLLPGLARATAHNLNQKQPCVALFEIANVFLKDENKPCEELRLGIALSGARKMAFNESVVRDEIGLLNLKGIMETLFLRLNIGNYEFIQQDDALGVGIYVNKNKIGSMGMLGQNILDKIGIKNKNVFVSEVSLGKLIFNVAKDRRYAALPRYPYIVRDLSFILGRENSVKEVIAILKETGSPLLRSVKVVDYYKGKQIPQGFRGITIECLYGSSERTLTEAEVAPVHELMCSTLKDKFQVSFR